MALGANPVPQLLPSQAANQSLACELAIHVWDWSILTHSRLSLEYPLLSLFIPYLGRLLLYLTVLSIVTLPYQIICYQPLPANSPACS